MTQLLLSHPSPSVPMFPAITYNSVPVLTTEMLATAYEVNAKQIRQNFNNNRERFSLGKHYFQISGNELKVFKNCVEIIDAVAIPSRTKNLTLWTDRGAARHAKMLESEKAWDVYEVLEDTFFSVTAPAPLPLTDAPITPDQQCTLQAIIKGKVEAIPVEERTKGLYPQIWSRFNNHFRIAKYAQLPQCRMSEAVEYLMVMDIRPAKALPPASTPRLVDRPAGPIETRLDDLRRELDKFGGAIEDFRLLVQEIRRTASPLHMEVYQRLGWHERCGVGIGSLTESLVASSCDSERHAREAYAEAYRCVAQARTLARLSGM